MGIWNTIVDIVAGPVLGSIIGGGSSSGKKGSSGGLGGWFGSLVGQGISGAAGGALDRYNDKRARQDEFDFYRAQGATVPEILGTGVGTGSNTASTVLGNQQAELTRIKRAQDYDKQQRELDRAVAIRSQDMGLAQTAMQSSAMTSAAGISAGASERNAATGAATAAARLAFDRNEFETTTLPRALNEIATTTPEWRRQELLAKMGVDNALATLILGKYDLDVMDPASLSRLSDTEFRKLVRTIYGYQSTIFRETAGSSAIISEGIDEAWKGIGGSGVRDPNAPLLGHQGGLNIAP